MNKDLLKLIKETIIRCFKRDLGTKYKYLIKDVIPFEFKSLTVHCLEIKYLDQEITELEQPSNYTHKMYLYLEILSNLIFEHKKTELIVRVRKQLNFNVECYFHNDNGGFSFSLLDRTQIIYNQYFDYINEKIKDLKIRSLVDNDYKINSETPAAFFTGIVRTSIGLKGDFFLFYNLARITQDTRFFVANMISLNPYVTNFLSDEFILNGKTYYRYFPTIVDKQYLMSAGILFGLFYNFWDQVGDILAKVFLTSMPEKEVFFGKVIDNISLSHQSSKNYQWLSNFKLNHYDPLNAKRRRIVHYNSLESDYFEKYQEYFGDKIELEKIQLEKEQLADYFLNHHNFALAGFEKMTYLISEK